MNHGEWLTRIVHLIAFIEELNKVQLITANSFRTLAIMDKINKDDLKAIKNRLEKQCQRLEAAQSESCDIRTVLCSIRTKLELMKHKK